VWRSKWRRSTARPSARDHLVPGRAGACNRFRVAARPRRCRRARRAVATSNRRRDVLHPAHTHVIDVVSSSMSSERRETRLVADRVSCSTKLTAARSSHSSSERASPASGADSERSAAAGAGHSPQVIHLVFGIAIALDRRSAHRHGLRNRPWTAIPSGMRSLFPGTHRRFSAQALLPRQASVRGSRGTGALSSA